MVISLGSSVLCAGSVRDSYGSPAGPEDLQISEVPGVAVREFIGADRIRPEHLGCNAGTVSFSVARTFGTVEGALAYISEGIFSEAVEGQLKFDEAAVFGSKSVVTNRRVSLVGCTVKIAYTIQG